MVTQLITLTSKSVVPEKGYADSDLFLSGEVPRIIFDAASQGNNKRIISQTF